MIITTPTSPVLHFPSQKCFLQLSSPKPLLAQASPAFPRIPWRPQAPITMDSMLQHQQIPEEPKKPRRQTWWSYGVAVKAMSYGNGNVTAAAAAVEPLNLDETLNPESLSVGGFLGLAGSGGVRRCGIFAAMAEAIHVPLLDQYMLGEMAPVFALAVGLCAALGMSLGALAGLVREVVVSGLPLQVAGTAAALQLPYFAAASMPMACLAATLFGLGRLQADMESVALSAAGVPLRRMLLTPLCLGLVAAALKLACHDCVVPYGSAQARKMVDAALTTHMQGLRQTENLIYQEYGATVEVGDDGTARPASRRTLQRVWYATRMEGTRLAGLLLLEVSPSRHIHRVVVADKGEWQADESVWKFSNGTVLDVSPHGNARRVLQVEGLHVPSARLTSGRALWKPTLHELSRSDIKREINELRRKLAAIPQTRPPDNPQQKVNGLDPNDGDPNAQASSPSPAATGRRNQAHGKTVAVDERKDSVRETDDETANGQKQALALTKLECFLHQRDAAAFSCVIYGLIGALATLARTARGSWSSSRAIPFAWALLGSAVYSAVSAMAAALGAATVLSPVLSAWLTPLVGLTVALMLSCLL